MKKILKSFTFWFVVIGIIGVVLNITGNDDINLFIGVNPILNVLSSTKSCRDVINTIPYLWHILSLVTMTGYGLAIDGIRVLIKKVNKFRFVKLNTYIQRYIL